MVDKEVDITYELFEKLQEAMLERIKVLADAIRNKQNIFSVLRIQRQQYVY